MYYGTSGGAPVSYGKMACHTGKFNLKIFLILFYLLFLDQEKSKINNAYRN
jgi:hypothetical protein